MQQEKRNRLGKRFTEENPKKRDQSEPPSERFVSFSHFLQPPPHALAAGGATHQIHPTPRGTGEAECQTPDPQFPEVNATPGVGQLA